MNNYRQPSSSHRFRNRFGLAGSGTLACAVLTLVKVAVASTSTHSAPQNGAPANASQSVPPGGFALPPATAQGAGAAPTAARPADPPPTAAGPVQAPARGNAPLPTGSEPPIIEISPTGTITLSAQNVPVDSLLELLSIRSKQNIVASDKVEGSVSVNLYNVPFSEALEAILAVNGLLSVREGAFIFVYTRAEFADVEKARRPIATQVFTLQFMNALDAESFIKPMMSKEGQFASRGSAVAGFSPTLENGGADEYAFTTRVVVTDYEPNLAAIAKVLKEIDVQPQQVRVEATVISASIDEKNAYGLDIAAIGNLNFQSLVSRAISPMTVPDALKTGDKFGADYPTAAQAASMSNQVVVEGGNPNIKMGFVTDDVAVFLSVLDDVTDTTVLARPAVTCLNRQRAAVLIGERVPYLSTTQNQTSTTQTVEFLDVGIKLTFRPFISDDGMIRMELLPSISDYRYEDVGSGLKAPLETTQELRTNVRVRSGQTVVLGGLFSDKIVTQRRQVPFLSDIPLVGGALTGQGDSVERKEIIFLVTPTVIEDDKLYEEGKDSLDVVENVRVGARAGLLPFSREQITANYQQDAFQAYHDGDLPRALYYSNAALRMKPVSPAMQQLRERVMAMPGSEFQDSIDRTLIERRTFSPNTPSGAPEARLERNLRWPQDAGKPPSEPSAPAEPTLPSAPAPAEPTLPPAAAPEQPVVEPATKPVTKS